ncbi:uncharacterized protein VTP21DRAFT_5311 [Calcarisporiella thermophila]|uniref:uncharacterized protein n=1 Tax=Calcarisporiella thermophila TaxID=911321 RepID=UPI003742141A
MDESKPNIQMISIPKRLAYELNADTLILVSMFILFLVTFLKSIRFVTVASHRLLHASSFRQFYSLRQAKSSH